MERFQHYFAVIRGPTRADVRHVLKGIIFTSHNELRWCDAPAKYGRLKTLYNRWKRSSGASVFAKIMVGLTKLATDKKKISNHSHQNCISIAGQRTLLTSKHIARLSGYNLKGHRSLTGQNKVEWTQIDMQLQIIVEIMSASSSRRVRQQWYWCGGPEKQVNKGGLVSCWQKNMMLTGSVMALQTRKLITVSLGAKYIMTINLDNRHDNQWNRIERMFGRIKDWRRVATCYERSPTVFLSAIMLAATIIFWV